MLAIINAQRSPPAAVFPPCETGMDCQQQEQTWNQDNNLNIYDQTVAYMNVRNEWTGHEWQAVFWPRVDEYATLEIPYSYESFQGNPNITVWVEFHGMNTSQRHYSKSNLVVGYWTVVIQLNEGQVYSVDWNEGCSECTSSDCIDNNCGVDIGSYCNANSGYDCEMKVFLAWSGEDGNSKICTSINSIPAAFKTYSAVPTYQFGTGLADNIIYKVQNTGSKIPSDIEKYT